METAIKKSIEGGYKDVSNHALNEDLVWLLAIISPSFWQALGKTEEWDKETISYKMKAQVMTRVYRHEVITVKRGPHIVTRPRWKKNSRPWLSHWHEFIDHLALGKSPDDFFTNLFKE